MLSSCTACRQEGSSSSLRPPALVAEYLGTGSLRGAIARRAEFLTKSDSVRIKLALDTARVSFFSRPHPGQCAAVVLPSFSRIESTGQVHCC